MPIATERLIGEVAKRHDLLLSRDDPVLVTVTLNELILAEALAQLQASLGEAKHEIAASTAKQVEASKTIAEQLITAAADYAAGEIRAAVAEVRAANSSIPDLGPVSSSAQSICWAAAAVAIAAACTAGAISVAAPLFSQITAAADRCPSPPVSAIRSR